MNTFRKRPRSALLNHGVLGIVLALGGVATAGLVATPAFAAREKAPAMKFSPAFQKVAAPTQTAINAAKTRADVIAAKQRVTAAGTAYDQAQGAARNAAKPAYESAVTALGGLLASEKSQLDATYAAATEPDDKFMAGQLALDLGSLAQDPAIQLRGVRAVIDSGKANPADLPKLNFNAGLLANQAGDYAAAKTSLQAATAAGYHENDIDVLLAEVMFSQKDVNGGLAQLKSAMATKTAAGQPIPQSWFGRGLNFAYNNKMVAESAYFSMGLVKAYPTAQNWGGAITVVRELNSSDPQITLDLMRLMDRTNSYQSERDYITYIESADPRRLPGEVLKVIDAGQASGKLRTDTFVTEARATASARKTADLASLGRLEGDARAANASAAVVTGIADAFLSYNQGAKAEALYNLALAKPGADAGRIQTRIGIAQVDQGKFAEAQQTFGRVTGVRQSTAQLWSIYAAQKAGGTTVG